MHAAFALFFYLFVCTLLSPSSFASRMHAAFDLLFCLVDARFFYPLLLPRVCTRVRQVRIKNRFSAAYDPRESAGYRSQPARAAAEERCVAPAPFAAAEKRRFRDGRRAWRGRGSRPATTPAPPSRLSRRLLTGAPWLREPCSLRTTGSDSLHSDSITRYSPPSPPSNPPTHPTSPFRWENDGGSFSCAPKYGPGPHRAAVACITGPRRSGRPSEPTSGRERARSRVCRRDPRELAGFCL